MSLVKPSMLLLNNFRIVIIFKTQFISGPLWRALYHHRPETPFSYQRNLAAWRHLQGGGLAQGRALCPVAREPRLSPRDTSWPGRTSRGRKTGVPLTIGQENCPPPLEWYSRGQWASQGHLVNRTFQVSTAKILKTKSSWEPQQIYVSQSLNPNRVAVC